MKAVRLLFVVVAVALLAGLIFSAALPEKPVVAQAAQTVFLTSPAQAFLDAAKGLPLMSPMSVAVPFVTVNVESASATSDYACTLLKQSPKDYTKMQTRQYFDMSWTIQNSGDRIWYASAIPFKYIGGTKMQTHGDEFSLPSDVGRGKKVTLVVDMTTPKQRGIYSTLWGLFSGNKAFCKLTITVGVNNP
jgi:hypothetical protein